MAGFQRVGNHVVEYAWWLYALTQKPTVIIIDLIE